MKIQRTVDKSETPSPLSGMNQLQVFHSHYNDMKSFVKKIPKRHDARSDPFFIDFETFSKRFDESFLFLEIFPNTSRGIDEETDINVCFAGRLCLRRTPGS